MRDVDLGPWLESALPRLLPEFLPPRRWFGGKARSIQAIDFEDAVWLIDSPRRCALVVAGVRYADGARERYALLLAFVDAAADLPVVGCLEQSGRTVWAVEAATDADAARALLSGFVTAPERPTLRGGMIRYGDTSELAARVLAGLPERGAIRSVGVEQSNTSLRVDRTLVFKLFRRLDEGENSELEVSRFLTTRTAFRAMPTLQGSLTYVSARGEASTVGVLQDWIENRGDGWSYVLALLRQPSAVGSGHALPQDLFALGATTADFHAALAADATAPAFAPEPATSADVDVWRASLLDRVAHSFALVEQTVDGWPEEARRLGGSLLDLRDQVATLVRFPDLEATSAGFEKIRVHGDYHLGQTLKTTDGFILIDFEGDPARPLAERRLKHCALKDVAGMIRSFDYAVETVRKERGEGGAELLSAERLRESFFDGYVSTATAHGAAFLPKDRLALDAWIDLFKLEKALYEVEYEINNRPAWVHIPLKGIVRILRGQA